MAAAGRGGLVRQWLFETIMQRERKQRHILMAWELGGAFGHISRIAALAKGFLARGHRVSLCLSDLSRTYDFVGHLPVDLYQAPLWLPRLQRNREPVCFSEILLQKGYGRVNGLLALTRAWQGLFDNLSADLLALDYAPTAFLATRDWSLPKIMVSSGFGESEPGAPDCCLRPWLPEAQEWTQASEKQVVGVVNEVLKLRHATPIRYVADLFQAAHSYLFMIPELNIQRKWRHASFVRPPSEPGFMEPAVWPAGEGKRVYAYLKPSSRHCLAAMQSIANLPCTGVIVCCGLAKHQAMRFVRPGLNIYLEPRDITIIQGTADVVVCHAGKNTISTTLLAGKPLLMIPEQLEQFHNALQIEQRQAGISVWTGADQTEIQQSLERLMTDQEFTAASRRIAEDNADMNQLDPVATVVDDCERLLWNTP